MIKPGAQLMSIEDYFRTELGREVRHEYVHGHIYAMAGAAVPTTVYVPTWCTFWRDLT